MISNRAERPIPIFVVGMNRSGTKWLSNILCNHTEIIGVQSEIHTGIVETNMLGAIPRAVGDLRRVENYIAMVELWSQTDFFKSSGIDKNFFYDCEPRPNSCASALALLMELLAKRHGARYWLQKASPLDIWPALEHFPERRLVLIAREMMPTLESRIQLRRNTGTGMSHLHATYLHAIQKKLMTRIGAENEAISIRYESLVADPKVETQRICTWLDIVFQENMLKVSYQKNTSFADAAPDRMVFKPHQRALITAEAKFFSMIPLAILQWIRERLRDSSPYFVEGTFREIEQRISRR
jgi:Sulfotransferase family